MAFRDETSITTYVICDKCNKKVELGVNLNFDGRMNKCLAKGFTFKNEDGVFKNFCNDCKQ